MGDRSKNPLKKDERYLIRVTDEKMARQMQLIMKRERLTQQEYLDKYHKPHMPVADWDIPYRHYQDFTRQFLIICRPLPLMDEVEKIINLFWTILMKIYRHQLDAVKVKNRLDQISNDETLYLDTISTHPHE